MLELWKLKKGKYNPVDKIVGWGVHPVVTKDYKVCTGSFKTGLLKGNPDNWVDRYKRFQLIYEDNPQHWLGNVYFDVHLNQKLIWNPERNMFSQSQELYHDRGEQQQVILCLCHYAQATLGVDADPHSDPMPIPICIHYPMEVALLLSLP